MAIHSVPTAPYRGLSYDEAERASELIYKSTAIVQLIQAAAGCDDLTDIAISGSCWTVSGMLDELRGIVDPAQAGRPPL